MELYIDTMKWIVSEAHAGKTASVQQWIKANEENVITQVMSASIALSLMANDRLSPEFEAKPEDLRDFLLAIFKHCDQRLGTVEIANQDAVAFAYPLLSRYGASKADLDTIVERFKDHSGMVVVISNLCNEGRTTCDAGGQNPAPSPT
jgi:hypothetical protein